MVLFGSLWDLQTGYQLMSLSSPPWLVSDVLAVYRPFQLLSRVRRRGKALINPMEVELTLRGWEPAGKGTSRSKVSLSVIRPDTTDRVFTVKVARK